MDSIRAQTICSSRSHLCWSSHPLPRRKRPKPTGLRLYLWNNPFASGILRKNLFVGLCKMLKGKERPSSKKLKKNPHMMMLLQFLSGRVLLISRKLKSSFKRKLGGISSKENPRKVQKIDPKVSSRDGVVVINIDQEMARTKSLATKNLKGSPLALAPLTENPKDKAIATVPAELKHVEDIHYKKTLFQ
uniref:Uncharacterized protein n=1 Tax=Cannabis sativa TaxID=3483 RepID=A0A803NNH7_CANSA